MILLNFCFHLHNVKYRLSIEPQFFLQCRDRRWRIYQCKAGKIWNGNYKLKTNAIEKFCSWEASLKSHSNYRVNFEIALCLILVKMISASATIYLSNLMLRCKTCYWNKYYTDMRYFKLLMMKRTSCLELSRVFATGVTQKETLLENYCTI